LYITWCKMTNIHKLDFKELVYSQIERKLNTHLDI
jgi:hypothetical protein